MKFFPFAAIACLLAVSCAASKKNTTPTASAASENMTSEERFSKWATGMSKENGYVQDANGNLIPRSDRRSSFESVGQDPNFTRKGIAKKEYRAGDYARKSFWGNKEVSRPAYAGATDGSRFQKQNRSQGQGAPEAGTAASVAGNYDTGRYATGTARESGTGPIATGSNDSIENRRKTYEQPEIISWSEQRKMSVNQSRSLLGRQ